jgi:undecaprenyl-diphosphatase
VTQPVSEGLEPEASTDLKPTGTKPTAATSTAVTSTAAKPTASGRATGVLGVLPALAGGVVAWVLTFGVLCAIGIPLAHYRKGNGNILDDTTIPHYLAAHRTGALNEVSYLGSQAGNTHMILAVGLIAGAAALAAIRRWRPVIFLLAVMFGELTLFLGSAAIVGRARPDVPHLDGQLPTSSFPSGHVAATILLYAAITVLVLPRTRAWWRWVVVAVAVLMPLWVAASRMYRGMHHPTDLLGSVVLSACWLVAMIYLIRPTSSS